MRVSIFGGVGFLALVLAGCSHSTPPAETAPPPAPPYEIHTLRDLVGVCRTAETDPYYASAKGLCWGYASGVLDFYEVDTTTGHRRSRICLPPTAPTRSDAIAALLTWTDSHPQFADLAAPSGLMRFYTTQYPCSSHPMRARKPAAAPAAPMQPPPEQQPAQAQPPSQ